MSGQQRSDIFVYTVISEEYMELGAAWGVQVQKVSGISPHFVCSDLPSFNYLQAYGFPCSLQDFDEEQFIEESKKYGELHFPNLKAVYTVSLKLQVALEYLQNGTPILYSDVDAIWLKDPISEFENLNADFAFQPGSFPEEVKQKWGFSVCTGFFFIKATEKMIKLADDVHLQFDGDDQRTLNKVLFEDHDLVWNKKPENWESCSLHNGWTQPVSGICKKTGLSAVALPHSYYQRHGTQENTCAHAIVCHPNSPKDQEGKYRVFDELGVFLPKPLIPAVGAAQIRNNDTAFEDRTLARDGLFKTWLRWVVELVKFDR